MEHSSIQDAMAADGYGSPHVIDDGVIHRFSHPDDKPGSNNCWYVSHGTAGAFGSWKLGAKHTWHDGKSENNEQLLQEIREYQRQRAVDMAIIRKDTAIEANQVWSVAATEIIHPYPIRKKAPPYGARQKDTMLLLPMFFGGKLVNLQRIYPSGKKRFLKGGQVTGAYMPIGDLDDHLLICEGWITGCSLHEHTGSPIAVAFNAGNLKPAALSIRKKYPDVHLTIAADNDVETERKTGINPGLKEGRAAAAAVGADLIYPDFSDEDFDGTDYNDFLTQGGAL